MDACSGRRVVATSAGADINYDLEGSEHDEPELESTLVSTESWVDWIRRMTGWAERELHKTCVEAWLWARHVSRMQDSRWTVQAATWVPDGRRHVGRQKKRWLDDAWAYATSLEGRAAKQIRHMLSQFADAPPHQWREIWKRHETAFVNLLS